MLSSGHGPTGTLDRRIPERRRYGWPHCIRLEPPDPLPCGRRSAPGDALAPPGQSVEDPEAQGGRVTANTSALKLQLSYAELPAIHSPMASFRACADNSTASPLDGRPCRLTALIFKQ